MTNEDQGGSVPTGPSSDLPLQRRPTRRRVVVLVSGAGTLLQALIDAASDPAYGVELVAVGADRDGIEGLARAERAGIPTFVCRVPDFATRADWDAALAQAVDRFAPELVVLAGFLKLAGPAFLRRFGGRTLNTHPALSPAFPGMHAPKDALDYGVKVSGCTLFLVDEGVDAGPIVEQVAVPVREGDDEAGLHERIKVVERRLLVEVVGRMARYGWSIEGRKVSIGMSAASAQASDPQERQDSQDRRQDPPQDPDGRRPVRRALVSVYDKSGLEALARGLHEAGVELVSTGSTSARIAAAGVPVTPVEEVTGFPEILDGRVKTLHPRVHAGLLADLDNPEHAAALRELDVAPFELVVSNLYPFSQTVASGASVLECVEQIDIGGPSMVRAAAKNHGSVAVVTEPVAYDGVLEAVHRGGFTLEQRRQLAARAFAHTASYDVAVASWMGSVPTDTSWGTGFPAWVGATWDRRAVLRYGENPHQRAALYTHGRAGIASAEQLHGKEMSYNNYVDGDASVRAAYDHEQPCVAIVKHNNPCGIAVGPDVAAAHAKAHACDPLSAYGGVVAANRPVTAAMAEQVAPVFTEVVLAPDFEPDALAVLQRKKNVRLLRLPADLIAARSPVESRPVSGGLLLQTADRVDAEVEGGGDAPQRWRLVAGSAADTATLADLAFAWRSIRAVKSNAILLARDGATVGIGMGQVNRVDASRLAVTRAGEERARGAVGASDAYFPFPDGLEVLLAAGVRAVVAPGGSVRDPEVVESAEAAGATLYFTGTRHFAH